MLERKGRRSASRAAACALLSIFAASLAVPGSAAASAAQVIQRAGGCESLEYLAVERFHDYTATQQQNALAGDFKLLGELEHIEVPPTENWNRDPQNSQRWRSLYHSFKWMDQLLFVVDGGGTYTDEERLAALVRARNIAVDWVDNNPLKGETVDERAWKDKVAGDRVGYLLYITVASACEGILSDAQANTMLDGFEVHRKFLSDPKVYNGSNHGLFVNYGLATIARYLSKHPKAEDTRELARKRFEETLRARSDFKHGVWLEHSPAYQFAIIQLVDDFREVLNSKDKELGGFSDRLKDVLAYETEPDGLLVPFGDTNFETVPTQSIIDRNADDPPLVVLRQSGYAFARATNSYLAIAASYFNRTHKHQDELSFDLFEGGQRVITDSGFFELDKGAVRTFQESPVAHSTLTIDGENFNRKGGGYKSGIIANGRGQGWLAVLGENPLLERDGVEHRRLFLYDPGVALIVIDRTESKQKHTHERHLQIGPAITTSPSGDTSVGLSGPGGYQGTIADSSGPDSSLRVLRGQTNPFRGFFFPGFRQFIPRDTLIWTSDKSKSLEAATTIGTGPGLGVSAAVKPANGKDFEKNRYVVNITGPGRSDTLKVVQDGVNLDLN